MKKPEGLILPEEIRVGLGGPISDLGWAQRGVAKESQVSTSLVSNLLSGKKRVKDRTVVAKVCSTLEQPFNEVAQNILRVDGDRSSRIS